MLAWFVHAISDCYYHGAEPAFPVPDLSSFLFPPPSLLQSSPLIYSYLAISYFVSSTGGGAQTNNALCIYVGLPVKLFIEAGSLI